MQVYLIAMGSLGDTLPFLHIGESMAARGHDVTLLANQHYQPLIESRGLHFRPAMTSERYRNFLDNRRGGDQLASVIDMGKLMVEQTQPIYKLLAEEGIPGRTVVCAQAYAVGARIAQEKLGIPLATAHLQPLWMRSDIDIPQLPTSIARFVGPLLNRAGDWIFDRAVGKDIMTFRQQLGFTPEKRFMRYWWNSPQCVMGLFPDWYVAPKPDWPKNVVLPGFPLPPLEHAEPLPPALERFLTAGDPPIVFSQSSIASEASRFFTVSREVALSMRRRAVFLTPHTDLLEHPLPDDMHHEQHVSIDRLLPKAIAHVHHGGMGMIAHSLRAGIPQLTVPGIFDQPDNAARLLPLGVSRLIAPKRYNAKRATAALTDLCASTEVRDKCQDVADRMRQTDTLATCCDLLEALAEGRQIRADQSHSSQSRRILQPASAARRSAGGINSESRT